MGELVFDVQVTGNKNKTTHIVKMKKDYYERINTKLLPEQVIKKSFEFLLDREPKESILTKFNITLISKYFPEFDDYIKNI